MREVALKIRQKIITNAISAGTGHIASALSIVDILSVLYFKVMKFHKDSSLDDVFVLSKGHSAYALYASLCELGFITEEDFANYHKTGTKMTSFPTEPFFKGLNFSSGSLGHGLSTACGYALAHKLRKSNQKTFCLLSDGECQEGSIWEAALFAGFHKLNNLCVIVDYNKLQALGKIDEILSLEPFTSKWQSFGFEVMNLNGHDYDSLLTAMQTPSERPKCIIANTIKGKGLSFMENSFDWHYLPIKGEFVDIAKRELGL